MSYNYYVHPTVRISSKLQQLRYDLDLVGADQTTLQRRIEAELHVFTDTVWDNGFLELELGSALRPPEREGIDGVVEKLEPTLFKYADAGKYIVKDEYGKTREVIVA
jgi:hypothetical protein